MNENKPTYFDETLLNDNVLDALDDMNFQQCTPIQAACIDPIIEGHDIMGVAQTGTGKTAAYLLPVLSCLDDGGFPEDAINCLIMSPTRELAQQIDQAMQGFGFYLPEIGSVAVYGGNDGNRYDQELAALRAGVSVVIATPGRLISHLQMGNLDLSRLSFFILDEADRMLDMGFSDDILTIAKNIPDSCQTIMFSATMPQKIEQLARTLLHNPVNVKIAVSKPAEKIQQSAYICHEPQKIRILQHLSQHGFIPERHEEGQPPVPLERVIIFSGKKTRVKEIARALMQKKVKCAQMHSDLTQAERDEVMYQFKSGAVGVLVATDIVSRGIDIDDIQMVINYDVPHDVEDYVHRIGRTARAQRDGIAITLVAGDDMRYFKKIEQFLEKKIFLNTLPDGLQDPKDKKEEDKQDKRTRGRRYGRRSKGQKQDGKHSQKEGEKLPKKEAEELSKNENEKQPDSKQANRKRRRPHHRRKPKGETGESQKSQTSNNEITNQ